MQSSDHPAERGAPRRRYIPIAQDLLRETRENPDALAGRLPSDRELAVKYGVSRATVREALFALDMIGAIEVRHGDGTYIASGPKRLQASEQFQYGARPEHVIDTRIALEPAIAQSLARGPRGIEDALRSHEEAQRLLDDQRKVPEFTRIALQFHLDLAAALENRLMGELAHEVISIDKQPLWGLINQLALRDIEHRRMLQQEHGAILRAIESGDTERAHEAMRGHLANNKSRIIPDDS